MVHGAEPAEADASEQNVRSNGLPVAALARSGVWPEVATRLSVVKLDPALSNIKKKVSFFVLQPNVSPHSLRYF